MSQLPSPMIQLPWPVTATLINSELDIVQQVVSRWKERFGSEEFIQRLDEADEQERAQLFGQFVNELKVVASKAATLVEVLA